MRDTEDVDNNTVGEKLCKHKYSSYPYCYGDITKEETLAGKLEGLGIMLSTSAFFLTISQM